MERERLLAALAELIDSSAQLADCPPPPDIANASCLHYLMLLATSVGSTDHRKLEVEQVNSDDSGLRRSSRLAQRAQNPMTNSTALANLTADPSVAVTQRRLNCQWLPLQRDQAVLAVTWLTFLTSKWRRAIACERESEFAAQLGARLVSLVVTYHRRIISLRRRLLQTNLAFLRRRRDPAMPNPALAAVT
jgi:hypothetical protein